MGQITEGFAKLALKCCEEMKHPSLTVWETQQLLTAWLDRESLRAEVASLNKKLDAAYTVGLRYSCENDTLIQQLAIAKEYAERLAEAGQAVVDRWHSPNWKDGTHTADYINRLRDAIRKSEG